MKTLHVLLAFAIMQADGSNASFAKGFYTNVPDALADHWMAKASSTEVSLSDVPAGASVVDFSTVGYNAVAAAASADVVAAKQLVNTQAAAAKAGIDSQEAADKAAVDAQVTAEHARIDQEAADKAAAYADDPKAEAAAAKAEADRLAAEKAEADRIAKANAGKTSK